MYIRLNAQSGNWSIRSHSTAKKSWNHTQPFFCGLLIRKAANRRVIRRKGSGTQDTVGPLVRAQDRPEEDQRSGAERTVSHGLVEYHCRRWLAYRLEYACYVFSLFLFFLRVGHLWRKQGFRLFWWFLFLLNARTACGTLQANELYSLCLGRGCLLC